MFQCQECGCILNQEEIEELLEENEEVSCKECGSVDIDIYIESNSTI